MKGESVTVGKKTEDRAIRHGGPIPTLIGRVVRILQTWVRTRSFLPLEGIGRAR
jgi:hypothetical protein